MRVDPLKTEDREGLRRNELELLKALAIVAMILCHPKVKLCLADIGKVQYMQSNYSEKGIDFRVDTWDGVPIVTSYNFMDAAETLITL